MLATRDIQEGEEVCFSYVAPEPWNPPEVRALEVAPVLGCPCICPACVLQSQHAIGSAQEIVHTLNVEAWRAWIQLEKKFDPVPVLASSCEIWYQTHKKAGVWTEIHRRDHRLQLHLKKAPNPQAEFNDRIQFLVIIFCFLLFFPRFIFYGFFRKRFQRQNGPGIPCGPWNVSWP